MKIDKGVIITGVALLGLFLLTRNRIPEGYYHLADDLN